MRSLEGFPEQDALEAEGTQLARRPCAYEVNECKAVVISAMGESLGE